MAKSNRQLVETKKVAPPMLPPWLAKLRQSAVDLISEGDLKEIITNQVKKAKEGDAAAIRFVFDYLLGGTMKGATFVQYNVVESPADAPLTRED
jgi:hypothetical protein